MNKKVVAGIGLIAGALGGLIYVLTRKPAAPCEEGTTKCIGYDLYTCTGSKWVLSEANSSQCGWTPGAATFELSNLVIEPASVNIGQTVNISVTVTNTGGQSGTKTVTLQVGTASQTKSVTLNAGESKTVSFQVTPNEAKIYTVQVDGLSGTLEVRREAAVFYSPYGCVENTRGYWTSKQSLAEAIASIAWQMPGTPPPDYCACLPLGLRRLREFPQVKILLCPYCGAESIGYDTDFITVANSVLSHIETSHPEFPLSKPPMWLYYTPLEFPLCALWQILINGEIAYEAHYGNDIGHKPPFALPLGEYHIQVTECREAATRTNATTELVCLEPYGPYEFDVTIANWGDRVTYDVNTNQVSVITWKELSGFDIV